MDARDKELKTVYFAHPITHYDSEFEWECIETIITMLTPIGEDPTEGYINIMNPNQKWLSNVYQNRKDDKHDEPFGIFKEIVRGCEIVVGVTFFDGAIGAGVGNEMNEAVAAGKDVYLIFVANGIKFFMPFVDANNYNVLSIEETRERIKRKQM